MNLCCRKPGVNLPSKKLVPAHVVPASSTVADVRTTTSADVITPSTATSVDTVASAAVAASQTYMKVPASVRLHVIYCSSDFSCRGETNIVALHGWMDLIHDVTN